jgi:predicted RNA-binding Zn-ribbon protein involved in translation (DUF1610 family)
MKRYVCENCGFVSEKPNKKNSFQRGSKFHCLTCGHEYKYRKLIGREFRILKRKHYRYLFLALGAEPLVWIIGIIIAGIVIYFGKM